MHKKEEGSPNRKALLPNIYKTIKTYVFFFVDVKVGCGVSYSKKVDMLCNTAV